MAELLIKHNRHAVVYDRSEAENIKRPVLPRQIRRRQKGVINQRPPRPVQRFEFALLGSLPGFRSHNAKPRKSPKPKAPKKRPARRKYAQSRATARESQSLARDQRGSKNDDNGQGTTNQTFARIGNRRLIDCNDIKNRATFCGFSLFAKKISARIGGQLWRVGGFYRFRPRRAKPRQAGNDIQCAAGR